MGKEGESTFSKEVGKWAIAGGVVAGIIGLFSSGQVLLAGVLVAAGGMYLRKD